MDKPRRDGVIQTDDIFKKLWAFASQESEVNKILEELQVDITSIGSTSPQLSRSVTPQKVEELKRKFNCMEEIKRNQFSLLRDLNSELFLWLGVSLGKEGERKGGVRGKHSAEVGGPNTDEAGWVGNQKALQEKEKRITELSELVEVYATIVAQHDHEEKKQTIHEDCVPKREIHEMKCSLDVAHSQIKILKDQCNLLQNEEASLRVYKESVEEKMKDLERQLLAASAWHKALINEFCPEGSDIASIKSSIYNGPSWGTNAGAPERIRAKIISPETFTSERLDLTHGRRMPSFTSTVPKSLNPLFSELRSLSPINVHNTTPQERKLLQRIALYESKLGELEQYEIDRKRCFDEMEKTRAELFTSMNDEMKRQKSTIQSLSMERESLRQWSVVSQATTTVGLASGQDARSSPSPPALRGLSTETVLGVNIPPSREPKTHISEEQQQFTISFVMEEHKGRLKIERHAFQGWCSLLRSFGTWVRTLYVEELMRQRESKIKEPESDGLAGEAPSVEGRRIPLKEEQGVWNMVLVEKERLASEAILALHGQCLAAVRVMLEPKKEEGTEEEEDSADAGTPLTTTRTETEYALKVIARLAGRLNE